MSVSDLLAAPFGTLPNLIATHAAIAPDRLAVVEGGSSLTYRELHGRIEQIAAALQRDGVKPGGAVAICAASSCDYVAVFIGALRAGAAACPLSPSSTPESLAAMVRDCDATHLFVDDAAAAMLANTDLPGVGKRISIEGDACEPMESWLRNAPVEATRVDIDPDSPFNIIYSSGTTGTPKGIVQTHQMRWGHVQRAIPMGYGPDSVTLLSTPLYSNTTLVSLLPTLFLGGRAVLMRKFDAQSFLTLAEKIRATHAMLVPVQYRRLMDQPDFDRFDLSSFRMKTCTSAPFAADLKADILKRWPGGLIEIYGMTEGGGSCLLRAHDHPDKLHTVGQPAPGHDIRIVDEAGRELPHGETGEIVGRSGSMMKGYHKQPAKTAEAEWFSPDGQRFIRTGDIGRFDQDGFLVLGDRKKDMIISGGFNIYPSDLEAVLTQHPAVRESAVVGIPSREWGETPAAFVVMRGEERPSPEVLRQWVNAQVGKTQRLSFLVVVDALPRSSIGKVLKRELRDGFRPPV